MQLLLPMTGLLFRFPNTSWLSRVFEDLSVSRIGQ